MTNLKNINFMSEARFNNLTETNADELYAVEMGSLAIKTGTVIAFTSGTAPEGYVFCNGAEISRETYSALFSVIGTTFGAGNGSTTFNVPDLRGRFIQGKAASGEKIGLKKEAGLPNITGTADVTQGASRNYNATGAFYQTNNGNGGNWDTAANCKLNLDASRSSSVYGKSSTVQPPAIALDYYIKY